MSDRQRSTQRTTATSVPDMQAAKRLPIEEVVRMLDLDVHGNMVRCWRPENHQHGDRTPSVGIDRKRNRLKCFVCDQKQLSTIDVVMSVMGLDTYQALVWLDAHFDLPRRPKGKYSSHPRPAPGRIGINGGRLEQVVRSGFWAQLSHAEKSLLKVFDTFADPDNVTISYAGLRQYSGISRDHTVSRALKNLANMHAIEIVRGHGGRGLPECSSYRLTLEDSRFLGALWECQQRLGEKIQRERQERDRRRARLLSSPRGQVTRRERG